MDSNEFLKEYAKQRSSHYFVQFWGNETARSGLTIKKDDGSEIVVLPKDIYCTDLGAMSGQCKCGHAIRYEYWLSEYGPIGSSCIKTLTGLDGADLRNLLRGGQFVKKDLEDFTKLQEEFVTLEEQRKKDIILNTRLNFLETNNQIPPEVQLFIDNNKPIPKNVALLIYRLVNKHDKKSKIAATYGAHVARAFSVYPELCSEVKDIISVSDISDIDVESKIHNTVRDIGSKIEGLRASPKAIDFFIKLVTRMENPQFIDALNVLVILNKNKANFDEFWRNMVTDMLKTALTYGLTEKQVAVVIGKTSTGGPGLSTRFNDYIIGQMSPEEKSTDKPAPVIISTISKSIPEEDNDSILDLDPDMPSEE
jgi:hypothetical protein